MNEQYPNLGHGPIRFEHETGGLEAAGIPDTEEWAKGASDSLQLLHRLKGEKRPSQGQRRTETRRLQDKAGNVVVAKVTEQYDAEKNTWNAVDVRAIREDKAGDDKGFRAVQNDPKTTRNEQRERGHEAILADAARRAEEAAKERGKGLQEAINEAGREKVGHSEIEAGTGINIERSPTGKLVISGKLPQSGSGEGTQPPHKMFDSTKWAFGFEILTGTDAGKVRIYNGSFEMHGDGGTTYYPLQSSAAYSDKTITVSKYAVIYAKWVFANAYCSIESDEEDAELTALEDVVSSPTEMQVPLYCFLRDSGSNVTLVRVYHMGNIPILPRQAP